MRGWSAAKSSSIRLSPSSSTRFASSSSTRWSQSLSRRSPGPCGVGAQVPTGVRRNRELAYCPSATSGGARRVEDPARGASAPACTPRTPRCEETSTLQAARREAGDPRPASGSTLAGPWLRRAGGIPPAGPISTAEARANSGHCDLRTQEIARFHEYRSRWTPTTRRNSAQRAAFGARANSSRPDSSELPKNTTFSRIPKSQAPYRSSGIGHTESRSTGYENLR